MVTADHVKISLEKLCGMHAGAYPELFFQEGGGGSVPPNLDFNKQKKKTRGPKGHCRSPEYKECEKNFGNGNTLMHVRGYEHSIPTKFHKYPSSGSVVKAMTTCSHTYTCISAPSPPSFLR